jgi:hypothetical protein
MGHCRWGVSRQRTDRRQAGLRLLHRLRQNRPSHPRACPRGRSAELPFEPAQS